MPTLAASGQFSAPTSIKDFSGHWWMVQLQPSKSERLANELRGARVQFFMPFERIVRWYGKQRRTWDRYLFPGYLFLCGDIEDRYRAAKSQYVWRVTDVVNQAKLARELEYFDCAINAGACFGDSRNLSQGQRVRVKSGPLMGIEGRYDHRERGVVFLDLDIMGRSTPVECPESFIEPI